MKSPPLRVKSKPEDTKSSQPKAELLSNETLQVLEKVESISNLINPSSGNLNRGEIEKDMGLDEEIESMEIRLIKRILKITRRHHELTAKLLNLDKSTLIAKIKHYKINLKDLK